ncbi:hypothetical protein [Agrobacterium pusense]|uniref:hypothetical protein n=1 Tax=Agrobacterium pusense TaxID=648995 RepID=UPI001F36861F|nr:hypothetical protein [Agrobacterium pusense]
MKTDWKSVRGMLNAAIDACERIEALQYAETDREAMIDIGGQKVSVHDFLVTAWTARRSSATRSYANATTPASISQAGGSAHSVGNVPSCN